MYAVNGRDFRTLAKSYLPARPEAPAVLWQVIDLTMRIGTDPAATAG